MTKLKTLILHPDHKIRASLRKLVAGADFLQVVGEAAAPFEALELLDAIAYGVFFLAVDEGAEMSGFELAQIIMGRRNKPALVFVSDTEAHAYRAIEVGASDFIVWPPAEGRMGMCLDKLKQFKAHYREIPPPEESPVDDVPDHEEDRTVQLPMEDEEEERFLAALKQAWDLSRVRAPEIEKLPVTQEGKTILIPYGQIIFVEAFEDYSYVHTANQKFLSSHRLKNLEERLMPHRFFRVHRKYLVNLDMVTEIASLPGSNFMLRTAGRTRIELPVGRRRVAQLKSILGL